MPWKETDPMFERTQFIAAYLSQVYSMTELCERFDIRRNTGDKWVRRSTEHGLAGLQEQSRAPHRCPHRLSAEVEAVLLEAKRAHLHWGPRKILPSRAPSARPGPAGAEHRRRAVPACRLQSSAHTPPWAPTSRGHPPAG